MTVIQSLSKILPSLFLSYANISSGRVRTVTMMSSDLPFTVATMSGVFGCLRLSHKSSGFGLFLDLVLGTVWS